jgi:hypothetical protein
MRRKLLARLLATAAALTALAAALTLFVGSGFAQGSAAQADYAPQNTAPPAISGSTTVGSTLTAATGSWNSPTQPSFSYQWQRCDDKGNGCSAIGGATSSTYVLQTGDVVTAQTPSGSTPATSAQTAVVAEAGPAGAIKLPNGKTSIPASSVVLPARLVIDGLEFQPSRVHERQPFLARFHVSDTRGNVVRNALVYALGLPYSWVEKGIEVRTDTQGWATMTITPSQKLPTSRGHALVIFVRARVEGQPPLAGASNRRLVQILTD